LIEGLLAAREDGLPGAGVAIHCPDLPTAARVHALLRRRWPEWPPAFLLRGERAVGMPVRTGEAPSDRSLAVDVLVEAQRFPAEERYRISETARAGRLLLTVDPGESRESWENLFLTQPRPEEMVNLERQQRRSRRIEELLREFRSVADGSGPGAAGTVRRRRGEVTARRASNLDECLASLLEAEDAGRLGPSVLIVASLAEDLAYLGRKLVARGWRAAYLDELERLYLPGPIEYLALLGDVVAHGSDEPTDVAANGGNSPTGLMLERLLERREGDRYRNWLDRFAGRVCDMPLSDLFELALRARWACGPFVDPLVRRRVFELIDAVPQSTPREFCGRPLWRVWHDRVAGWFGAAGPATRRLALLTSPDRPGGGLHEDAVYLCAGSEPPAEHARVVARVTDRILILYHDRSPLPGDELSPGH
jgi:hypothetical protein